ncbi:sensor domain-containing diguanylate cyclase [Pseudoalteromonas sp. MMG007]|uniref:sensor domain-containing diguanylate cyclase n=1 Tax=Pseudoalteromonas sp. MMG007 TaxID=2822684 RepID=UPI001B390A52|nr:sensor domain-containing diguanylate cyclase [Pseudoalteromonas sp. MMG007]MBQ4859588.1 sensor domain-containing diguanylate cyclase [Pseudoalteromonas sp. MMG007]
MIKPTVPVNEEARLRALKDLKILDTDQEERFDRVTRIARRMFNVAISLVTLIDEDRQFFKSKQGIEPRVLPRDTSFCGHTINNNDLLIINDTQTDERFFDNPFVLNDPNIRFYAGYPLVLPEALSIGTLCIADTKPRHFSYEDQQLLKDLGALVEQEIQSIQLATIDDLTKISNRRGFLSLAEHTFNMCKKNALPISIILFDLDKFKQINDFYGHHEGDLVLNMFAKTLLNVFKDADVIGRLGGDEFVVMISDSGESNNAVVLKYLADEINQVNIDSNKPYNISYSAGIVNYSSDTHQTVESMIEDADRAMYQQKKQQR